jgi:ubiquinone/menaquinone biosynthesis C-methylase UbiE
MTKLTARQCREKEFYEKFSKGLKEVEVSFSPVLGEERRPWNSYWFVYEFVKQKLKHQNQRLLDFGCGYGVSSLRFAKVGYEVYGFDISENNINIARKNAERHKLDDKIHLSIQIAEQLNYPSDFFDIISGIDILHHVEIKQAVTECFRVLKKDGTAIFREHIEVPIFDKIRDTVFGKWLVPKEKSFCKDKHITEDEKKLVMDDIRMIKGIFPKVSIYRFTFLSRFDRFLKKVDNKKSSLLEQIDYFLFKVFPFLKYFGGSVILILKK